MDWTEKQREAIEKRDANILVAAAAGSGKTAVLVERIKRLVIEDRVSVDRMLVVTFTSAAASEMKEKIREAIYRELEEHQEDAGKLREQLNLIGQSNISTFHGFALEVIRTFFYKNSIEPNFGICDDSQRNILKEEAMDELLTAYFESEDKGFVDFLDCYSSGKNQQEIRNIIDKTYGELMAMPDPWNWLEDKIKELYSGKNEFMESEAFEEIGNYVNLRYMKAWKLAEDRVNILENLGLKRMAQIVRTQEIEPLRQGWVKFAETKNPFSYADAVMNISLANLRARKEEKPYYDPWKNKLSAKRSELARELKTLKEEVFYQSMEEHLEDIWQTSAHAEMLKRLLLSFDQLFKRKKAEKNLLDFNDIEHLCLLVLEDPEVSEYYRDKFQYIFIDEYQDTNILQEEIISRIKRKINLFMVGDVKQSIYKFRLAEPEIFIRKYEEYSDSRDSVKIDLNQNFRSKSNVLESINSVFEDIMSGYDDAAKLYPGDKYKGPLDQPLQTHIIDTADMDEADEGLQQLAAAEIEALYVSKLIKENLGKPVYDSRKQVERPLQKRDIVILMRGVKNKAEILYNTLKENGIDAFIDESDGYFDTMEINIFLNLLAVIDNKMQDIPLISALHSEIFGFSSRELGRIRANHKTGTFCNAFTSYARKGSNRELRAKCRQTLDNLKEWKKLSTAMPLGEFLWKLLTDTGYYMIMGTMPNGAQRQANLRVLIDKAESYASARQVSLYSFIRYIESVKSRDIKVGQVKLLSEQDDLVRIMTIHKSKGLEFPMVILSGIGRKLQYGSNVSHISLHKNVGFGLTLVNHREKWFKKTLLQKVIADKSRREEVEEEKRILYVAMTRARDYLYLVGTSDSMEKHLNPEDETSGDSSYLDMIGYFRNRTVIPASAIEIHSGPAIGKISVDELKSTELSEDMQREIAYRLNYTYPYREDMISKQKYSVTELNQNLHRSRDVSELPLSEPAFMGSEKKLSPMEEGTAYHKMMEYLDFSKACSEGMTYIQSAGQEMISRGILTEEEEKSINLINIESFFSSELGCRCAKAHEAGRMEKEKPFVLQMEHEGKQILVQGVIDCMFEEDGEYVLVDYKTNRINRSRPFSKEAERIKETYQGQIDIYRNAIEQGKRKRVKEAYLYLSDVGRIVEI